MKLIQLFTYIQANWELVLEIIEFLKGAKDSINGEPQAGTLTASPGDSEKFPLLAEKCKEEGVTFDCCLKGEGCCGDQENCSESSSDSAELN